MPSERPELPAAHLRFFARNRGAWRAWLQRHHASRSEVWLLFYKRHTGKPCVTLAEAVEEALCYGWIDGKLRRIDDEQHLLRICPRKPGSVWSLVNKERVRRLIAEGRMTEAGLRLVEAAKKSGQWQQARTRDQWTMQAPGELVAALAREPRARDFFEGLAPSYRKIYIAWLMDAKRDETRHRRVRTIVDRCLQGKKPGIDL